MTPLAQTFVVQSHMENRIQSWEIFCFFTMAQQTSWAKAFLLSRIQDHRHITLGGTTLDEWSARRRPLPDNTQHLQETNIHVSGGIRTHNLSRRAAADPRLRPHGRWDRLGAFRSFLLGCHNRRRRPRHHHHHQQQRRRRRSDEVEPFSCVWVTPPHTTLH